MNCYFNKRLIGADNRPFTLDVYEPTASEQAPVVVFLHGFKGFKDWGHWHQIAQCFAAEGFVFIKFNFSHNGTRPETPVDFSDLEAFGQNNFSKELFDLQRVLDFVYAQKAKGAAWDVENLGLIGHSRGGPIALLTALEDARVKKAITWASVQELDYSWKEGSEDWQKWKEEGCRYQLNGRTKQNMPQYFQLYEDFQTHKQRLRLEGRIHQLNKPVLLLHGTQDPAVPHNRAAQLQQQLPNSELALIEGADHVFGGSHPYTDLDLPPHTQELLSHSLLFLRS